MTHPKHLNLKRFGYIVGIRETKTRKITGVCRRRIADQKPILVSYDFQQYPDQACGAHRTLVFEYKNLFPGIVGRQVLTINTVE